MINDIKSGKIHAIGCFRRLRNDEIDACALGNGSGPFDVQVSLGLVTADKAGIGPIENHLRRIWWKTKEVPKIAYVLHIDVCAAHDRDGLARSIDGRRRVP